MVKKIALLLFVGGIAVAYFQKDKLLSFFNKNVERTVNTTEKKLLLRTEPTSGELIELLKNNEIIKDESGVIQYLKENNLEESTFAAGKYIILTGTRIDQLINGFLKGENGHGNAEVKVNVVFNNCIDIEDIGKNISKCILADSASIVDYIYDSRTLKKYGFTVEQIPAMFIPDTYQMYFDIDAKTFVDNMAIIFKEFWTAERKEKLKKIGLSKQSEAVTIASVVYQEQSRVPEEWPIIAKLYLNRVERGIPLEADPTFKFCWPDRLKGVEHLYNYHKEKDCPYNTYLHTGIPPGPIALPPSDVVDAVLNPADVDYIFLCGNGSGRHNFASTNAEHNKNVAQYRKWLKEYEAQKRN